VRLCEHVASDRDRQIATDAAHAATIADEPANRTVEHRSCFHHAHEFEWRQLWSAQPPGQPKPEETCIGQGIGYDIGEPPVTIERCSMFQDEGPEPSYGIQERQRSACSFGRHGRAFDCKR
jgi:hypothetical protein